MKLDFTHAVIVANYVTNESVLVATASDELLARRAAAAYQASHPKDDVGIFARIDVDLTTPGTSVL